MDDSRAWFSDPVSVGETLIDSNPLATVKVSKTDSLASGYRGEKTQDGRPLSVDLAMFQFDMLLNYGRLEAAEELLEKEVRKHPDCLPLLLRLGRLDEVKGQYLNAFDLYRQAADFAGNEQEQEALCQALLRTRTHLKAEKINGANHYIIRIEGNGSPLELLYVLEEEKRREELYRNISEIIERPADRVLEFECAAGMVSRGLAAEGFTVEAASASMTDLMLALGFDTYFSLQAVKLGSSPEDLSKALNDLKSGGRTNFFMLDLNRHAARTVELTDVIMLLPAEAQWYLSRGSMEVAALLQLLAARARKQLIFYLPPGYGKAYRAFCFKLISILESEKVLLKSGRSFTPLLGAEDCIGGKLYMAAIK